MQSVTPSPAKKCVGDLLAYARFPPPEPTTCNEIDPATQFGFSNDPDHITRIQILIFPAYCTENSPLLNGGESVRMITRWRALGGQGEATVIRSRED